jgi:hypothetical protein
MSRGLLLLSWPLMVDVANHEPELAAAQQQYLDELTEASGPLGLIGTAGVAILLNRGKSYTDQLVKQPGFPNHVLRLGTHRAWYRSDVEAHRDGKRPPRRASGELQSQVIDSPALCRQLGLRPDTLISYVHGERWRLVPPPAGG